MLYKIGTVCELQKQRDSLPSAVYYEILHCVLVLDECYGENRNYYESGGYCIFTETCDDLAEVRNIIDYEALLYEWLKPVGDYHSRLYLLGDNYSIVLITSKNLIYGGIQNEKD